MSIIFNVICFLCLGFMLLIFSGIWLFAGVMAYTEYKLRHTTEERHDVITDKSNHQ